MQKLNILKELKDLIPPLSESEYTTLEQSLLDEGCRDKIVTWNDTIIDGHNRYEICTKHNILFNTEDKDFDSIEDVKIWMIDNQKGRRNLSDGWKFELAQMKKEILLQKGKSNMSAGGGDKKSPLSTIDKPDIKEHNTQKEIASDLGWSTGKVAMADVVWKKAPEPIREAVKAGDISINQAYKELKTEEKKKEREEYIDKQREDIRNSVIKQPDGLFDVIVIDPPWNYGREYDPNGSRVANPYPEMSQKELINLNIPSKDNCVMFLWTTHAFIWDAKELLDNWGFTYKATLVWDKEKIGMGAWFRMQCEFCLVGIKGKPFYQNTTHRDIIRESRREHSRKPNTFYSLVEDITEGRRIDFFSREKREGWEVFGNESNKF
jgi:N6-adenosine-specific RNA methylase IME4